MVAVDVKHSVTRSEVAAALVVSVVVAAGWFALASSFGAVGIARNDDWSFLENAFRFADTGVFAVGGWVQMMLIGQLLLASPVIAVFGLSVAVLQGLVALLAALALLSGYLVLRNFLSPAWALTATAVTAASAVFGLLAASFMTDVPAAAFQLLALAVGYRALRAPSIHWPTLVAATVIGIFAFSIREYAVAALAAIWIMALRKARASHAYRAFAVWTIGIAFVLGFMLLWRAGQVTFTDSSLGLNLFGLRYLAWWPLTAGWLLLPVLAAANPISVARRAWTGSRMLTIVVLMGVGAALLHTRLGFLGNYLSLTGGYAEALRGVPSPVLPQWWSVGMTLVAAYGALVLALILVGVIHRAWDGRQNLIHRPTSITSLAVTFVLITALIYAVVPVVANVGLFDRYFIAVLPIAAGLIIWWLAKEQLMWRKPAPPVIGGLVIVALTNTVLVAATSARDAARWQLASEAAEQLGVAEGNVDGGFDYFTFNTNGGPRPEGVRWTWWTAQLGDRAVCATVTYQDVGVSDVAAGPDPSAIPIAERTVSAPLARDQLLRVYLGPDSC